MNKLNLGENLRFGQNEWQIWSEQKGIWGATGKTKVDVDIEWEQNTVSSES